MIVQKQGEDTEVWASPHWPSNYVSRSEEAFREIKRADLTIEDQIDEVVQYPSLRATVSQVNGQSTRLTVELKDV